MQGQKMTEFEPSNLTQFRGSKGEPLSIISECYQKIQITYPSFSPG